MRELLGGTEENSVFSDEGSINLPSRQINDFSQKGNRKKIELVARPGKLLLTTTASLGR